MAEGTPETQEAPESAGDKETYTPRKTRFIEGELDGRAVGVKLIAGTTYRLTGDLPQEVAIDELANRLDRTFYEEHIA